MTKNSIHVQARAVIIKDFHILLCKTIGLEPDFYFLPGGHIEHGESAENAIIRELMEEIGFPFEIKRFLGCLEYSFDPTVMKHAKCHTHEYNFIFEVSSDLLTAPDVLLEQLESHIKVIWIPLENINHIDIRPEPLKKLIGKWHVLDLNNAFKSSMV